jgi:hypothetical protein
LAFIRSESHLHVILYIYTQGCAEEVLQGIGFLEKISKGDKGKHFENYESVSLWREIVWAALLVSYLSFKFSYIRKNFRTNFK